MTTKEIRDLANTCDHIETSILRDLILELANNLAAVEARIDRGLTAWITDANKASDKQMQDAISSMELAARIQTLEGRLAQPEPSDGLSTAGRALLSRIEALEAGAPKGLGFKMYEVGGLRDYLVNPADLRDQFAGQALAGYLASYAGTPQRPNPEHVAEIAYEIADAMIEERKAAP